MSHERWKIVTHPAGRHDVIRVGARETRQLIRSLVEAGGTSQRLLSGCRSNISDKSNAEGGEKFKKMEGQIAQTGPEGQAREEGGKKDCWDSRGLPAQPLKVREVA